MFSRRRTKVKSSLTELEFCIILSNEINRFESVIRRKASAVHINADKTISDES